ncbi:phosphoribosylformylglycinamidine cyclo-ligase [Candidatus Daviesbacteria bacterium]|nr:phosphoribosylformylglycinamidine cyclo-ligase [Candidatus Daviesbacteria bacterium]
MSSDENSYSAAGVKYEIMDPVKKLAQEKAKETSKNLSSGQVLEDSRGESAFVWEEEDSYRAFVIEGLGTKNLVADEVSKITGKTYYGAIAQDTVAMIINDLIVVGAKPQVLNAYFAVGNSDWFNDKSRNNALIEGWVKACNMAGVVWGGGETPTLKGIVNPETIELAGSAVGEIKPKSRLILGDKIQIGDSIILIESSGIHANGLTLTRTIAEKLPDGFATKLDNGESFGEALLKPTHLYAKVVQDLFEEEVDIHYMVNITGHGFRKLMRARQEFSYIITQRPPIPQVFKFIQEKSGLSDEEMYATFNMGVGFAVLLPKEDIEKAQDIAKKHGFNSWNAGVVEEGQKQVVIKPLNITFSSESLGVR